MAEVLGTAVVRIQADTAGFHASASRGILSSMTRLAGSAAAIFGGLKLGEALFVDPIRKAGEFQKTLNILQVQAGATKKQMSDMSAEAIKLGNDVSIPGASAQDAATAMLTFSKAGLSVKDSMAAARAALITAAAAQTDSATSAEILAGALNAFSLSGNQAARVANLLAGAANAAQGDITDFAPALAQAGTAAHQLGVPVQDTVTALTELAKAGIQGSDAGTSLRTMLQRLVPQTKIAKDELKLLGVDAFNSQGQFKGLENVAGQFQKALAHLTPEERAHALQVIFGTDAVRAANVILGQGAKTFDDLRDKVSKSGQAQQLAAAASKGFSGAMAGLQNTIETLQIQIGLRLLPVLTSLVQSFSAVLPGAVNAAVAGFVGLAAAVASVVGFYQRHNTALTATLAIIAAAVAAFTAYKIVTLTTAAALRVAAAAQLLFDAALTANPIGIVIVAIAALVAALVVLYTRSSTARAIIDAALAGIQAAFRALEAVVAAVVGFISAHWRVLVALIPVIGPAIALVATHFNTAKAVVGAAVDAMKTAWHGLQTAATTVAGGIKAATTAIGHAWDTVRSAVSSAISAILRVLSNLLQGFAALARGAAKVPLVGRPFHGVADAVDAARAKVDALRNSIDNLHDKTVHVTVVTSATSTNRADRGQHRMAGGPVFPGVPYIVGEARPELFIPDVAGRIAPRVSAPQRREAQSGMTADLGAKLDRVAELLASAPRTLIVQATPGADAAEQARRAQREWGRTVRAATAGAL